MATHLATDIGLNADSDSDTYSDADTHPVTDAHPDRTVTSHG